MQHLENIESRPDSGRLPGARPVDVAEHAMPMAAGVHWKRALKALTAAAFRLHHYRFMRTRMLHDALSGSQGSTKAGDCHR